MNKNNNLNWNIMEKFEILLLKKLPFFKEIKEAYEKEKKVKDLTNRESLEPIKIIRELTPLEEAIAVVIQIKRARLTILGKHPISDHTQRKIKILNENLGIWNATLKFLIYDATSHHYHDLYFQDGKLLVAQMATAYNS